MTARILSAGVSTLLLMASPNLLAAEDKPSDSAKKTDDAQMKKQCNDMRNMDMSKMSAAEHEAMMKKCKEAMQENAKKKPNSY